MSVARSRPAVLTSAPTIPGATPAAVEMDLL